MPTSSVSRRVLCVDDNPASQRLLMAALMRPGWSVECLCESADALAHLRKDPLGIDVLVLGGPLLARERITWVRDLRAGGFAGGAIVLLNAVTTSERRAFRNLGVTVCAAVPRNLRTLGTAIESALRRASRHAG